jgi:hypothetical protein
MTPPADTVDPCNGRPDGAQCYNNQTIAPTNTPGSGSWFQVWNFDTKPPTIEWHNAAGLVPAVAPPPKEKKTPTE